MRRQHRAAEDHIVDLQPAAGPEHAECLGEDLALSSVRLITQLEMITSTEASSAGSASA